MVRKAITELMAEIEARPIIEPALAALDKTTAAFLLIEARRLARISAKKELRHRGIRLPWEVDVKELNKIADAMLKTDRVFIENSKANLEKYKRQRDYHSKHVSILFTKTLRREITEVGATGPGSRVTNWVFRCAFDKGANNTQQLTRFVFNSLWL